MNKEKIEGTTSMCPIEVTYASLQSNVDGDNAFVFSQQTQVICHEEPGYKADFIINSIARCAESKNMCVDREWVNKMKALNFKHGFNYTLDNFLLKEMIRVRYPYQS